MKRIFFLLTAFLFTQFHLYAQTNKKINDQWVSLLDKNFLQWETYLSYRHQPGYKGEVPLNEKGDTILAIGYNINQNNVFSIIEENGEPVLKVTGEIYGCAFTKNEFENYHLKLKVKWGKKKWPPRTDKLMDAGVVYHSQGKCGVDYWRSWMLGQEFQVMQGHMGDYWNIGNAAIDIKAFLPEGTMNPVASPKQSFLSVGSGTANTGFCMRSADYESDMDTYTNIELICFNGRSLHIVNGKVVMILSNSRYWDGTSFQPLIKGKIQLQSEGAEVYYKAIQIKKLTEFPKEYAFYFK